MRDSEFNPKSKIEVSVKQKKQVQHELIGNIVPHEGHTLWQINKETLVVDKAKFANATYIFGGVNKKEVIIKDGFAYVAALNKKNALKKYLKGSNGTRDIDSSPMPLFGTTDF